ncbi:MAG TPA: hypothetical protein VGN01_07260 [Acidobacteriaceae bacterium]|jgi:hypothetical protein
MTEIFQVFEFLRNVRFNLRFGEWSRGHLELKRIEVRKTEAWCDWVARPVDEWDAYIPAHASASNFTAQTLEDAINIRAVLFGALVGLETAELRAFRALPNDRHELILRGTAFRDDKLPARNTALAMRAKLLGFHFTVADGSLICLGSQIDSASDSHFSTSFPTHLKEVS